MAPIKNAVMERVQVSLSVELGRTNIVMKDLCQLRHGQVVSLAQSIGEPLAIFVNGQPFGAGQVVLVGTEQYGIRVTELHAEDADHGAVPALALRQSMWVRGGLSPRSPGRFWRSHC